MEYISALSCCCKKDDKTNTIRISCNLNCFKNKTYTINITEQDDIDKVVDLIKELEKKQELDNGKNKKKNKK